MKKIFITLLSISLVSVSFSSASNLKRGMSGKDVKSLQELLVKSNIGFNSSNVTGYYGPLTAQAVANLQNKYGLSSVGYVGPKTTKVIDILNQLSKLPVDNNTSSQITNVQTSNNVTTSSVVNSAVVNASIDSARGQVNTKVVYGNVVNGEIKIVQNESRLKSDDYKKVLNNNTDTKTGFVKPSFATSTNGITKVIVRYKTAPTVADENKIISRSGSKKKVYNLVPMISAEVADTDIDKISSDPNVLSIEKDEPVSIKSDAEYANTWGVTNTGAKTVYTAGVTGNGVKVAVLDTGIDYNHTDLNANYAGGYNFITGTTNTLDDNGHGTHVAGIISALNNGAGVVGMAPEAKIYALKILDASGNGYSSNVISALDWAVNNGMQVVNVSFGTPVYPGTALEDAFINAEAKGLVVVAASGNAGTCAGDTDTVYYPARFASVISVGAIDSANSRPCFSSVGPNLEISAPGSNINSTMLGGGYAIYSGTSMAAPHVAGEAADLISVGVKDINGNGRINDEVRDILDKTTLDLGTAGRDNIFGFGSVKIDNAVAYLNSINTVTPVPVATTTPPVVQPVVTQPIATTTTITQPITTTPTTITPIVSPIVTTPTTSPVLTQPVITQPNTITPITAPYVMPNTTNVNVIREKLENELDSIRKGVMGDYRKSENSNSDNSHRSETSNTKRSESSRH